MSNFMCPTCGFTNIDCGKLGYKTEREIELEKKLEIAVNTLEFYANESHFGDTQYGINGKNEYWYEGNVEDGTQAREALVKIKEIK